MSLSGGSGSRDASAKALSSAPAGAIPSLQIRRSIANSLRVELNDGAILEETVEYPIGHRRRRKEGMPLLVEKFKANLRRRFPEAQQNQIIDASLSADRLDAMPVNEYVDLYLP